MRKLNGITINGEYLGNSVVINGMFRAICTISPVIMRDFVNIINKIEKLDDAVKILNFNCGFDSIDIEFGNKLSKGIASLYFKLQNSEPKLTNYKLVIDGKEYSSSLDKISLPNKSQMTNPNTTVDQSERQRRLKELREKKLEQQKKLIEQKKQKIEELKKQKLEELKRKKELQSLPPEERKLRERQELLKKKREELLKKKQEAALGNSTEKNQADIGMDRNLSQSSTEEKIDEIARSNQPELKTRGSEITATDSNITSKDSDITTDSNITIPDTAENNTNENLLNKNEENEEKEASDNIQSKEKSVISQDISDNKEINEFSENNIQDETKTEVNENDISNFDDTAETFDNNEFDDINEPELNDTENSIDDFTDSNNDYSESTGITDFDNIDFDNLSEEELAQLEAEVNNEINNLPDSMSDFDSEEAMLDAELNRLMGNDSQSFGQSGFNYSDFAKELNDGLSQGLIQGLSQGLSEGLSQGLSQGLSALFGNGGFNPNMNNGGAQNGNYSNNIPQQNIAPDYTAIDNLNNDAAMSARDSYSYDENSDLDELSDFYSDFYSESAVEEAENETQGANSSSQSAVNAEADSDITRLMAELEALKAQAEPEKNLMSKDEFLDKQKALEEAKEKKRRQKFKIVGSREKINASALDDGIFVAGKKFYKWGDTKILDT